MPKPVSRKEATARNREKLLEAAAKVIIGRVKTGAALSAIAATGPGIQIKCVVDDVSMQVFGSCSPTDCDWGMIAAHVMGRVANVVLASFERRVVAPLLVEQRIEPVA